MGSLFVDTAWLLWPLLAGGILHGVAMKYGWTPWLAQPIDAGRAIGGVRWFGDNKTWRGAFYMAVGVGVFTGLEALVSPATQARVFAVSAPTWAWFVIGLAVGFIAMLGELPNSFVKRRCGIAPDTAGTGPLALVFYIYDQVDVLTFVVPAWALLGAVTLPRLAMAFLLVVVIHQALSSVGYRLGMRKTAR